MPEEKSSTAKQIVIGVAVTVLSTAILVRLGLQGQDSSKVTANHGSTSTSNPQPGAPSNPEGSSEPTRMDLAGTWRAEGNYMGAPTEYLWWADNSGSCSLRVSNAVAQYPALYCSWEYSDNVLEERYTTGLLVRMSLRVVNKSQIEVTIIDSNDPSTTIGTKLMYSRL
jgi:hypothetical protein